MSVYLHKFPTQPVLDYREARSLLQDGDVLLCSGNGVFSQMIQQATDSIWSHAALVLRLDSIDRVMLLESVEPVGVRTVRLSKYLDNYRNDGQPYPGGMAVIRHRHFADRVDKTRLAALAQFAVDRFGHPYDREDIAKIAARIMSSKFKFTEEQLEKIRPNEEYICSEYVARCYEQVGIRVHQRNEGFVAPSDFAADPDFELVAVLKSK